MSRSPQNRLEAEPTLRARGCVLLIGLMAGLSCPLAAEEPILVQATLPELLEQASGAFPR